VQFVQVRSRAEALAALAEWGDDAQVLAGGTDIMLQCRRGQVAPGRLLHIEPLDELRRLEPAQPGARTSIGSLATHRQLSTHDSLRTCQPALAAASGMVGGWQTQSVGTLGGNIANASPAADCVAPLLVAEAQVTLASHDGERHMDLRDFMVGRRQTALQPHELITAIDMEPLPAGVGESYVKVGRRGAMDVAIVGIAARIGIDEGTVSLARVAMCSMGPVPLRVPGAEAALLESTLQAEDLDAAAEALVAAADPIDDARASARYRIRIVRGLLERAVDQCRMAS